jgi:hypothetical protein
MISRAVVPLALIPLLAGSSRGGEETGAWKRIESMPREQRLHLSKVLDEFDALPSQERAAIRDLDAALAKLPPEVQARYRSVLRRYHVWVGGLDDKQKEQLSQAGSVDAKLALVLKWRKEERDADTRARRNLVFGVHPGDLGTLPPVEMANALRVWRALDAKEQAEVEKIDRVPMRLNALRKLAFQKRIVGPQFPAQTEEGLVRQLEDDETFKAAFRNWLAKREKKAETDTPKKAGEAARLIDPQHQLAESLYFAQHPPSPVSPANLARFEAEIPTWLRATMDPLPPDDARRRLTVLYRQIYPSGQEIPPPAKEDAKSKAVSKPEPKPASPPAPAAPF